MGFVDLTGESPQHCFTSGGAVEPLESSLPNFLLTVYHIIQIQCDIRSLELNG